MARSYIRSAPWDVEFASEFESWWNALSQTEQGRVDARVRLLMERGPSLGFRFSSQIRSFRFAEMRGNKSGDERWYEANVTIADRLFGRTSEDY